MSEYRPSYVSPPRDSTSFKSDRSFPKPTGSHNLSANDLSYQDLKYEYSKVLNHLDSIRQERGLYKNPLESVSGTKAYTKLLSPSTTERSPYRSTGKITSTYNRYPDAEKRVIELEQEVSETKKLLDSYKLRITTLQRENHDYQERIKDFQKIDHYNKQLGFEMKTLDHEILTITKQMRELEQENARLIAEKNSSESIPSNKELPKNLKKYGKYILHLLSTLNDDHFGRFCFEERFTSEQELLKLIETSDSDKLLMQSFRYVADLLLNVSSTAKASTEPTVIPPQREGQAYLVDLNETITSVPKARAVSPKRDSNELIQPRRHRHVLTEPDQGLYNERDSLRKSEDERKKYSEKPEDARKQYLLEDKSFDQRRKQYEDQRTRHAEENDDRRLSAKERAQDIRGRDSEIREERGTTAEDSRNRQRDTEQYARDTEQYVRESNNYMDRGQRQSLAQSQRNTNQEEYGYRNTNESQYRQERRHTDVEDRQYLRRDEQPAYKKEEKRYDNVQERYQPEQPPPSRSQERQYGSTKEEPYSNWEDPRNRESVKNSRRVENVPLDNRQRALSTERQPTPEVKYSESMPQSRGERENQNQGDYESDYYSRRVVTEEAPATSYYDDIPKAPVRVQSRSPTYKSDRKALTQREASPKPQYQIQGQSQGQQYSNQTRQSEDYYQNNRPYKETAEYEDNMTRSQQYEVVPKPSIDQTASRAPEIMRQASHVSENAYQKTPTSRPNPVGERSSDVVNQSYHETPKLTKRMSSDRQESQGQYKSSTPPLGSIQRRESRPEKAHSPRQETREIAPKQQTVNIASDKGQNNVRDRSKSPKDIKKSNSLTEQSQLRSKQSPSPRKVNTQNSQSAQNAGKMLSPGNPQVSQIVYKNPKSSQGGYSPISSSKSSKGDITTAQSQGRTEEKDLIQRENDLIQRIRELREKERELMEKEREISQKTEAQFKPQQRESTPPPQQKFKEQRQASFKEPSVAGRSPKLDQKKASQPNVQTKNYPNTTHRDSNYYEEAGEPREVRPVAVRHELSPKERYDEGRSPGLKSILKNPEPGYEKASPHEAKYANRPLSPFRSSSFDDPNDDGFSSVQSRNQFTNASDDYPRKQYQDEFDNVVTEGNHQKRLTFGNNANFDSEFTGSRNYSQAERRDTSPGTQISPQKQKGTNFASFKVSFGRTESKFKSPSPEPKIPSILDVPRRKKVDPSPTKYDIIKGKDVPYQESPIGKGQEVETTFQSGTKNLSVVGRDVSDTQRERETEESERVQPKTPEKKGNAGQKLKSILIEQKWEIVKE